MTFRQEIKAFMAGVFMCLSGASFCHHHFYYSVIFSIIGMVIIDNLAKARKY